MSNFARQLALGNAVGYPAQVFKQHDAQCGRQSPQFAQPQFAAILVGVQKSGKNLGIQHAVGMRNVSPGNAVNARQPLQGHVSQFGQTGVVPPRHSFANLLQLRFYQREIVEQPLRRWRGVVTTEGRQRNVIERIAQCAQVFLDTRKKRRPVVGLGVGLNDLRLRQAKAVLFKTLKPKQFRPDRCFGLRVT